MLQIFLLGGARLTWQEQPWKFTGLPKTLPLLAYLLLQRNAPTPRDHLAFTLWPDVAEVDARSNLRRHLHDLRRALPPAADDQPWLLVDNSSVQWNPAAIWRLDVAEFEQLRGDPSHLAEAVRLYTGDLLPNLYDDWVIFQRERLRTLFLDDLLRLVQAARQRRDYAPAIAYAQRLLQHDPVREDVVRELMSLRHAIGDRTGALQEYSRFAQRLREELEVAPMVETSALYDAIARQIMLPGSSPKQQNPGVEIAYPVPTMAAEEKTPPGNLPAQLTAFVGREPELAAVHTLLNPASGVRLLTLTGPGGCGKTRLALEAATRLRRDQPDLFPSGLFFVSLSTINDPELLLPTIADVLGLRTSASLLETLQTYLRARQLLLILDNFEHLIAAAPVLLELLSAAPGLRILVTSRAVLRIYGEQEFPVTPLPLPDPVALQDVEELARYASVLLFTTRSRAVNPNFVLTRENAATVAEICLRLDGLPLTIELAAARSKLLTPQALLARLTGALGARLLFLSDRNRGLAERHQTLRATLVWSYNLLGETEQRLFQRLAVFAGSFSLEAAEAICGDDLDVLTGIEALVDNSLLGRVESDANLAGGTQGYGELRFRMLSIVHEYALEQLSQNPQLHKLRRRHAEFYLNLAQQSEPKLKGSEQALWLKLLDLEQENVRAALRWALDEQCEDQTLGLQLATAWGTFWVMYGHLTEGHRWLTEALDKTEQAPALLRAPALLMLGTVVHGHGDLLLAPPLFEQSLALYQSLNHKQGMADAFYALGRLANRHRRLQEAEDLLRQSLALSEEANDTYRIAYTLNILAFVYLTQNRIDEARTTYQKALAAARSVQDKAGIAFILTAMGELERLQGDYRSAETYYNEAMRLARELNQKARIFGLYHNLAYVALHDGEPQRAAALFREGMRLGMELPDKENFGMCLIGLGSVAAVENQVERAASLFGAGEQALEKLGAHLTPPDQAEYDRYLALARRQLDQEQFILLWQKGRTLTLEQVEQLALRGGSDDWPITRSP